MATAFFDLLFSVSDLPPLVFSWLDPTSLALAACVCRGWRNTARKVRGSNEPLSHLVLVDLVADAPLLAWTAANLNEKRLPATLQAKVCNLAARNGALAALQWARENGCDWDELTCAVAAKSGHLEILQWARENGCDWDELTCDGAAARGGPAKTDVSGIHTPALKPRVVAIALTLVPAAEQANKLNGLWVALLSAVVFGAMELLCFKLLWMGLGNLSRASRMAGANNGPGARA